MRPKPKTMPNGNSARSASTLRVGCCCSTARSKASVPPTPLRADFRAARGVAVLGPRVQDRLARFARAHRRCVVEALNEVATHVDEPCILLDLLDTLGNNFEAHDMAEFDDRLHERLVGRGVADRI